MNERENLLVGLKRKSGDTKTWFFIFVSCVRTVGVELVDFATDRLSCLSTSTCNRLVDKVRHQKHSRQVRCWHLKNWSTHSRKGFYKIKMFKNDVSSKTQPKQIPGSPDPPDPTKPEGPAPWLVRTFKNCRWTYVDKFYGGQIDHFQSRRVHLQPCEEEKKWPRIFFQRSVFVAAKKLAKQETLRETFCAFRHFGLFVVWSLLFST